MLTTFTTETLFRLLHYKYIIKSSSNICGIVQMLFQHISMKQLLVFFLLVLHKHVCTVSWVFMRSLAPLLLATSFSLLSNKMFYSQIRIPFVCIWCTCFCRHFTHTVVRNSHALQLITTYYDFMVTNSFCAGWFLLFSIHLFVSGTQCVRFFFLSFLLFLRTVGNVGACVRIYSVASLLMVARSTHPFMHSYIHTNVCTLTIQCQIRYSILGDISVLDNSHAF